MDPANAPSVQSLQRPDPYSLRATTGAIYFGAALFTVASIVWLFFRYPNADSPLDFWSPITAVLLASPLVFLLAIVTVFSRPRLGYSLGLAAGLMALPWFARVELALFSVANSWIALNATSQQDKAYIVLAELRILSVAFLVIAIAASALRLLSASWRFRQSPLRLRTWPAFAASFLVLVTWFSLAAKPYRIPLIADRVHPELGILHVEKQGMQFRETEISVYQDRRFWVSRNDRRLFQYEFDSRSTQGILSQSAHGHALDLTESPELLKLHTGPAKALRSWNAEGWYVVTEDGRVLAFTSEYGTSPPPEIVDVFHEIEKLPAAQESHWPMRDVCLGFCYDPLAGLGFMYANSHCSTDADGSTRCR
jgi:hypothetical protein